MNVTDKLRQSYLPKAALIVYEKERGGLYSSSDSGYYLETRPVKEDGSLGCAKPVSVKFIRQMVETFRNERERLPYGPMPSNLLYADPSLGRERYVWWNPPRKRKMYFTQGIPLDETEYNVPGTIYCVRGNDLEVYCFSGKRPKPGQELLFGPFYNYYQNGRICLGSAKLAWPRSITWQDVIDHWETIFWNSENSHMMHNPCKDGFNLNVILKEAVEKPFDTSVLKSTCRKLNSLWQ